MVNRFDSIAEYRALARDYLSDETEAVETCLDRLEFTGQQQQSITRRATELVEQIRLRQQSQSGLDAFLSEYDLSSEEGIVLMCLAEALIRIPDSATADRLIEDKLGQADWQQHLGRTSSLLVNAGTWGLMLTGRLMRMTKSDGDTLGEVLGRVMARSGEPVIRVALKEAMKILSEQFVMGRTIDDAWQRSQRGDNRMYRYSFDMLGEAALSRADADEYFTAYREAMIVLSREAVRYESLLQAPAISIKLTALHPRFETAQHKRVVRELIPRVLELARLAARSNIAMTIDAEEAKRLELTLEVFAALSADHQTHGWQGLGIAVQAYQKRALAVIDWLAARAARDQRCYQIRLVKGAYWDSEIKQAQIEGLPGYPVYTRKQATDVSYLACARRLFDHGTVFYPQFATHNAHTVAAVIELADTRTAYEFQRLHGMGEALYQALLEKHWIPDTCRVYAPVGAHVRLLPYLVRRLLENGANTSFVNRLAHERMPVSALVADPVETLRTVAAIPHPKIPLPAHLYGPGRLNSSGMNLHDINVLNDLVNQIHQLQARQYTAQPLIGGEAVAGGGGRDVVNPANQEDVVGTVSEATAAQVQEALRIADRAASSWSATAVDVRAAILERAADVLEQNRVELIALLLREGGRCIEDSMNEVREAVDYCRYYAAQARKLFSGGKILPGPSGESNILSLQGRGIFVAISPWNFPLAIFTGQIAAALASGNAVIAKPASQTPLIAARAVRLLHEAGIPVNVLHYLPGSGSTIGDRLVADTRIAGVTFTGSTLTARHINRCLAGRDGPLATLIAETGGQNAMIVDSSALPEQFVPDVLRSAFNSAGQRCSALRVLFVQQDIFEQTWRCLTAAAAELTVGDPADPATDIGPVIDNAARSALLQHCQSMQTIARRYHEVALPDGLECGNFIAPCMVEIDDIKQLPGEIFGPILHVIRFRADELDRVIDAVNATGYGLTLGIHTRIQETAHYIRQRVRAGNVYINRNMIGAVVGSQPFGGEGLSGTGPKAGGPNYLVRFAVERTCSTNTAAVGGNASLLTLADE